MNQDFIPFDNSDDEGEVSPNRSRSPFHSPVDSQSHSDNANRPRFVRKDGIHRVAAQVVAYPHTLPCKPALKHSLKRKHDMGEDPNLDQIDYVAEILESCPTPPWAENKSYSTNPYHQLHEEILDFVTLTEPTESEQKLREIVLGTITEVVKTLWWKAEVYAFGSYATNLYLPHSDLDVTVHNDMSERQAGYCVRTLATALRSRRDFTDVEAIISARVPIVKVTHISGFCIDVSFNQESGFITADYINDQLKIVSALRPLALVLKMFLFSRESNEVFTGGLSSYSTITMILAFFNSHPLIQSGIIRAEDNLGLMLVDFLNLFGKQFNSSIVAVHDTGFYPIDRGLIRGHPPSLVVMDPKNDTNILTIGSHDANEILDSFSSAHDVLSIAMGLTAQYQRTPTTLLGLILDYDPRLEIQRRAQIRMYREIFEKRNESSHGQHQYKSGSRPQTGNRGNGDGGAQYKSSTHHHRVGAKSSQRFTSSGRGKYSTRRSVPDSLPPPPSKRFRP